MVVGGAGAGAGGGAVFGAVVAGGTAAAASIVSISLLFDSLCGLLTRKDKTKKRRIFHPSSSRLLEIRYLMTVEHPCSFSFPLSKDQSMTL